MGAFQKQAGKPSGSRYNGLGIDGERIEFQNAKSAKITVTAQPRIRCRAALEGHRASPKERVGGPSLDPSYERGIQLDSHGARPPPSPLTALS